MVSIAFAAVCGGDGAKIPRGWHSQVERMPLGLANPCLNRGPEVPLLGRPGKVGKRAIGAMKVSFGAPLDIKWPGSRMRMTKLENSQPSAILSGVQTGCHDHALRRPLQRKPDFGVNRGNCDIADLLLQSERPR